MEKVSIASELIEKKTYVRWFWDILNYQLFEVEGHPFTLSKIAVGLVLLGISYLLARRAARAIESRLFGRMQIDDSLRYALGRFSFYFFLVIFSIFSLHLINVPITIFAVVGSAVAIGVGFGSQNIISNFISGLLVMIERPIRLADYVELDTLAGTVQEIGIRSTVLLTPSNARVIVPNTMFLEKSVINWTLGDHFQATSVRIGVAYDSDVPLVEKLCKQAAHEVESVLKERPVTILFSDFGDNALLFDVGFWCLASTTGQRKKVESDVRFRLHALFTQNGVSMPFPQRELHLKPLDVRMLSKSEKDIAL